MAKSAYLIVSDLHDFYKNLENRVDYVGEIEFVKEHILEVGLKYRNLGYEVNIILLGDVFHRAYQDVNAAVISNNFWVISKKLFKHIYCVIGNHETSYYSNNPFYTLVSEIRSKKMQTVLNKVYTPRGLDNVFEVVDAVEDGDVVFHFNHYGCSISHAVNGKVNIGLYHQDILNSEILKLMQATYNNDVYAPKLLDFDKLDIFDGFTYNFFGHMHQVYGTWGYTNPKTGKSSVLCYLASLGRSNVTEVNDDFLERNVPAVLIDDGHYSRVENNLFLLPDRQSSVREDIVKEQKAAYQVVKEQRELKNYSPMGDDPVNEIENVCNGSLLLMFQDLCNLDIDRRGTELLRSYQEVMR